MFKRLILTGLAICAAAKKSENSSFGNKEIALSSFEMQEPEYHVGIMAIYEHQAELEIKTTDMNFEKTNKEVKSFWQKAFDFVGNLPTTMCKNLFYEKAKADEVKIILDRNFKDRDLAFEKFEEDNNIEYGEDNIQHSDIVKNSFGRMHEIINVFINTRNNN